MNEKYKTFWVFGNVDAADKSIRYYIGSSFRGGYLYGDLQDAMRFDSWSDLVRYVSDRWQLQDGIIIREIASVTLEKLVNDVAKNDMTLYRMMHDPCQAY